MFSLFILLHYQALSALTSHNPDLLCLTETWIKHTTICTELAYYVHLLTILFSVFHVLSMLSMAALSFLFMNLLHSYHPPKTDSRPWKLHQLLSSYLGSKISVFNVYRPPSTSHYSKPNSVFLDAFNSFLSLAANAPHEFIITGDFNIHVYNCTNHFTSQSLSLLSSFNLTQLCS